MQESYEKLKTYLIKNAVLKNEYFKMSEYPCKPDKGYYPLSEAEKIRYRVGKKIFKYLKKRDMVNSLYFKDYFKKGYFNEHPGDVIFTNNFIRNLTIKKLRTCFTFFHKKAPYLKEGNFNLNTFSTIARGTIWYIPNNECLTKYNEFKDLLYKPIENWESLYAINEQKYFGLNDILTNKTLSLNTKQYLVSDALVENLGDILFINNKLVYDIKYYSNIIYSANKSILMKFEPDFTYSYYLQTYKQNCSVFSETWAEFLIRINMKGISGNSEIQYRILDYIDPNLTTIVINPNIYHKLSYIVEYGCGGL